ncbi:MAG: hypothetical protein ACFFDT_05685 [Candidatus Hodarchaeota archaeon]
MGEKTSSGGRTPLCVIFPLIKKSTAITNGTPVKPISPSPSLSRIEDQVPKLSKKTIGLKNFDRIFRFTALLWFL